MKNSIPKNWLKKLTAALAIAGASTAICVPVLAKFYPPSSLFQPSAYRNYPYRNSQKNIADTLTQEGKFADLVYELNKAQLLKTLKNGRYTVLAPTNEAFKALPKDVYQRYSQPENRLKVLKYHLVSGVISDEKLDGKEIPTLLEGQTVKVTVDEPNGTVKLNDAIGKPPSLEAQNGVVVEIDKVLLPPGF
uniref:Beta-Ig-H3/fasciclin n=1 Tax=Tolypothrix bouteillei VB521301 TaxID=1479485 RepID=A0A0C1QSS9_9CYAN